MAALHGARAVVVGAALYSSFACVGAPNRTAQAEDGQGRQAREVRFALEVGPETESPVYVLVLDEDGQPGWIRVFRGTERVYLRERCEIEDCARRGVVCGASVPVVRELVGGVGTIELVWDGTTSVLDPTTGCETREPTASGDHVARFCYSRQAELDPVGDPATGVTGRLIGATCVDRPFTSTDAEVVLRI